MYVDDDEPEDELIITLQMLGGGLIGVILGLTWTVWAYRRWYWVS